MLKEFYLVELLFTTMYIKFFLFLHNYSRLFTGWGHEKARDNPSELDHLNCHKTQQQQKNFMHPQNLKIWDSDYQSHILFGRVVTVKYMTYKSTI